MKMLCVCCQMMCSIDVSLEKSVVFLEIYVEYCVMQKRQLTQYCALFTVKSCSTAGGRKKLSLILSGEVFCQDMVNAIIILLCLNLHQTCRSTQCLCRKCLWGITIAVNLMCGTSVAVCSKHMLGHRIGSSCTDPVCRSTEKTRRRGRLVKCTRVPGESE